MGQAFNFDKHGILARGRTLKIHLGWEAGYWRQGKGVGREDGSWEAAVRTLQLEN